MQQLLEMSQFTVPEGASTGGIIIIIYIISVGTVEISLEIAKYKAVLNLYTGYVSEERKQRF